MKRAAPIEVVTVSVSALRDLIRGAVLEALAEGGQERRDWLTATAAARLARRRTGDVLRSLASGDLRGRRRGKRWEISREAIKEWAHELG